MFNSEKKHGDVFRVGYILCYAAVAVLAVVLLFYSAVPHGEKNLVGCVLTGSRNELGWNSGNYTGLAEACSDHNAELRVRENVPEEREACLKAIQSLASEGCRMIFLTSYGYAQYAAEVAGDYPQIKFYANGSEYTAENMSYCFVRMYQGRYLSGILAGLTTKTNIIGYVAAMPNNEVNRGINAFALGVRSVNPEAVIRVRFTGSWDDPVNEKASVELLASQNADIIAYHQNEETVPQTCEQLGVDFIGYHKMSGAYSDHLLTAVTCRWRRMYGIVLQDDLRGRSAFVGDHWLGLNEMTITLTKPSAGADSGAVAAIMKAKARIEAGRDVFSDTIYDNNGVLRCGEGEMLSDAVLLNGMDWFAEGVEIVE